MEINITEFFNSASPRDYSASVAEIGNNAGAVTWQHALDDSPEYYLLDNVDKREAFKGHIRGYGAWSDGEIAAWSDFELNALFIQFVSAEIREFRELANSDWKEWERLARDGTVSGQLFGDELSVDGQVYFSIEG